MPTTTWSQVEVNDLVEGSNHSVWSVAEKDSVGRVVLVHSVSGRRVESVVDLSKPVVVVVKAADTMAAAEALVKVKLGGEDIARRNEAGLLMCPPAFPHLGSLLSHLYVFHYRQQFDAATIEAGVTEHHRLHESGFKPYEDHVHDPDYLTGRAS